MSGLPCNLRFLPGGKRFVLGTSYGLVLVYSLEGGTPVRLAAKGTADRPFTGFAHSGDVRWVESLSDGRILSLGGDGKRQKRGDLCLWSQDGELLIRLELPHYAFCAEVCESGAWVLLRGLERIRVWALPSPK